VIRRALRLVILLFFPFLCNFNSVLSSLAVFFDPLSKRAPKRKWQGRKQKKKVSKRRAIRYVEVGLPKSGSDNEDGEPVAGRSVKGGPPVESGPLAVVFWEAR
jgi:hypothetical protein